MHAIDAVTVDERGLGEHGQTGRGETVVHDQVWLVADEARDAVAVDEAGARVHPVGGVADDPGERVAVEELIQVHHAEHGVLRLADGNVAPANGREGWLCGAKRIEGGVLVADDDAIGDASRRGLEADLPVDVVGVEEGLVDAGGLRGHEIIAHVRGPVLVVEVGDKDAAREECRAALDFNACRVGDVVAFAFEPADHVVVAVEEAASAVPAGVGTVEGDLARLHSAGGVPVVEALATPVVVGLVSGERELKDDVGGGGVIAEHEEDVLGRAGAGDQLGEIHAANPIRRWLERVGDLPVGLGQAGGGVRGGDRLIEAGQRQDGLHEAGAGTAVPAHAVDLDVVGGGRGADA